jgi:hypothetical protein
LDAFFRFTDFMGEEIFLLIFLPWTSWCVNERAALHECVLLVLTVAFGNYLKNIFLIERPHHPELWTPLGRQKLVRYLFLIDLISTGSRISFHVSFFLLKWIQLDSSHASNAAALPFYLVIYAYLHQMEKAHTYPIPLYVSLLLAFLWATNISFGRCYLGYHSFIDVVFGFCQGITVMILYYLYMQYWIDDLILSSESHPCMYLSYFHFIPFSIELYHFSFIYEREVI